MVRVYLSRHGRTWQNEYHFHRGIIPENLDLNEMYQLNEIGVKQASTLGKYLKGIVKDPKKIIFVSSTLRRSIDSTTLASEEMGIDLVERVNFFPSRLLLESVPIEYYEEDAVKQYYNDQKLRESLRVRGIAPSSEIADGVSNYFLDLSEAFPDHEIIAILHKSRNSLFLRSKGITVPRDYKLDNCGLYTLDIDENNVTIKGDYKYNSDLEREVILNELQTKNAKMIEPKVHKAKGFFPSLFSLIK